MTDFDPRYGEAVDLGNAIARITAPNAGPFTGPGTNSYLIGERRLMLLDPGPASRTAASPSTWSRWVCEMRM